MADHTYLTDLRQQNGSIIHKGEEYIFLKSEPMDPDDTSLTFQVLRLSDEAYTYMPVYEMSISCRSINDCEARGHCLHCSTQTIRIKETGDYIKGIDGEQKVFSELPCNDMIDQMSDRSVILTKLASRQDISTEERQALETVITGVTELQFRRPVLT